jgi:signal transduction histidine kinase
LVFILSGVLVLFVSLYSRSLVGFTMGMMEYNIEQRLKETSKRGAALVTAERLDLYRTASDMERPDYRELRTTLYHFANESDVLYVYYLRVGNGLMQYVVDNDYNPETQVSLATPPLDEKLTPGAWPALAGKVSASKLGNYTDGWEGLLSAYAPIFDRDGKVVAICGVDINDEQIAGARLRMEILAVLEIISVTTVFASGLYCLFKYRREAKRAKEASLAKSRFLSGMSHEIRTPMNAIIGMSELVQRETGLSASTSELVTGIKNAGLSLMAIINDILDFSKIESGKLILDSAPYETGSVLNDTLNIIQIRLAEKPIELISELDPNMPAVLEGDATRVRQILINILSNAVKYTEKGFIRFEASFVEFPDDLAFMTFRVEDTGRGIRSEDLPNLFSDFVRVSERWAKNIEGTGLGLSITKSLCRAMGGDIEAESEYGHGSVFTASIKQKIIDRRSMGGISTKKAAKIEIPQVSFIAPEIDVLLVDDMPSNLLVAEGLLAPYRVRISVSRSGLEALELVKARPFDIIFMDHMMPGIDGLEATKTIRAMGEREAVPIIALTANAVFGMKEIFLQNGFSDFLPKPIEVMKLSEIMEKWVPESKRLTPSADKLPVSSVLKEPPPDDIEGLNFKAGLSQSGGSMGRYLNLMEVFCRDTRGRLAKMNISSLKTNPVDLTAAAHALKGSLAAVGALELAGMAKDLESAGRTGDMAVIPETLDSFILLLGELLDRIEAALEKIRNSKNEAETNEDGRFLELLSRLKEALALEDLDTIDEVMDDLKTLNLRPQSRDTVTALSELILRSEFKQAAILASQ